ncbi:MAG: minor capsid protein [Dysgonamonadaceae bacterium]|nr:minor capsid protein [Dysgonamonadaceae bacterium]
MQAIHEAQTVNPDSLRLPDVRNLIDETYRILSNAVDYGLSDNVIPEAMARNLDYDTFMFSGMKIYNEMKEGSLRLRTGDGTVKPFETFLREAKQIDETYNTHYLEAEYNFAVHSAQMAAKWADVENDGDRYNLQYRTVGDDRVREEHRILNRITLPASDSFWDSYYPPNGWNCRCTAVQVLKDKYPESDHADAMEKGETATFRPDKSGRNRAEIFRFNPGKRGQVFPPSHPYRLSRCNDCNRSRLELSADIPSNEKCQACRNLQQQAKRIERWTVEKTKKGEVRVSSLHGKDERKENVEIATWLADTHGYKIDLLQKSDSGKSPDSFNRTLNIHQEYKRNNTPTVSSIDNAIRDASKQANNIVLDIKSDIAAGDLRDAITSRVRRKENIETITVIRNKADKTYTREEILSNGWTL